MALTLATAKHASESGPQSVGRVFAILDYLVANPDGATLSELATFCDAPKTSLVGLLSGLVAEACVEREASGRYVLGPRVLSLAARASAGGELKELARPFLVQLVEATGETAVLGTLAPDADLVVYVDKVESPNPIRYAVTVGERRELYCTALGKVLLAWFPKPRLAAYLASQRLQRFTDTTITSASALSTELSRIRKEELARTSGERAKEANGLAAPVFLPDGTLGGGLLIAGPASRMHANRAANEKHLRRIAAALTDTVGGNRPSGA